MLQSLAMEPPKGPIDLSTLAGRLKWVMEQKGWSARHLSREAGLKSDGHVGLILSGRIGERAAGKTLSKLASAAGVSLAWLQNGEGGPYDVADAEPRWRDHPGWAGAVAKAREIYKGTVPPFAYDAVGNWKLNGTPETVTPEDALQLANVWVRVAPLEERTRYTTAWARAQAVQAASGSQPPANDKAAGR